MEAFQVAMEQKQRYKSRCSDQPQSSARPFPFTAEVRNFDGHITVVARAMGKKKRKARVEVPNGEILSFTGYADGRFFCNIEGYTDAALSVAAHHIFLSTAQHEALSQLGIVLKHFTSSAARDVWAAANTSQVDACHYSAQNLG